MSSYEIYNLILCLIVFILLTGLFSILIVNLIKLTLKTINAGLEDENIKKEHLKQQKEKGSRILNVLNKGFPIFVCFILGVTLIFSLYARFTEKSLVGTIPTIKVVQSGSMSDKHANNDYLTKNNLNDQIQTFDLIILHQLPKEEDLKIYDIVVYQYKEYYIVHRIVAIEEPNERHPNERWFLLQGDANARADEFPVTYDQMRSVYRGERIPFVGTFVEFMQSPAGMLCFLLIVFATITTPIVEKKINNAKKARLAVVFADELQEESALALDFSNRERKTFKEKLILLSKERKGWYEQLVYVLNQLPRIRVIQAKYHEAYRIGNKPIAKIAIKGKSLYVYLAVNANDYQGIQFGFKNVSSVKAHGQYSAECKVTSERKLKNIKKIIASYGENIRLDMPVLGFENFKKKRPLTLKQRFSRLPAERKARFKEISQILSEKVELTKRESKTGITFKKGRTPIAKLTIKGKSVYINLAVNPKDYTLAKYGIKDVSNIKAHANYPAQCKITSDRKLKYIKEIISEKL